MADHAHVGFGDADETSDIATGLLVVERQDDHRALALLQPLHATCEPVLIYVRHRRLNWSQYVRSKLFEQAVLSLRVAAEVEHRHPARSQHKGRQLLGFPQAARS